MFGGNVKHEERLAKGDDRLNKARTQARSNKIPNVQNDVQENKSKTWPSQDRLSRTFAQLERRP